MSGVISSVLRVFNDIFSLPLQFHQNLINVTLGPDVVPDFLDLPILANQHGSPDSTHSGLPYIFFSPHIEFHHRMAGI
jgi:hypothetical protein